MFDVNSVDEDNPKVQAKLQDITERMSLLLTSYEGPSDKLSQRLALKREKENEKMKAAIFDVLTDFNQIVDERDNLLASIKSWFDGSSKLMQGVNTDGNAEEAWEMIENEMKKLFGVLQAFKNSSKDISELERRLLKVVFKDTNVGELEKVRNKIYFNSFRKMTKSKLNSHVENNTNLESVEEIKSELSITSLPNENKDFSHSSAKICVAEIQVDFLDGSQTNINVIEKLVPKVQTKSHHYNNRINVAIQTDDFGLEHDFSNESIIGECLPDTIDNTSMSYLEDSLVEILNQSDHSINTNNMNSPITDMSNNEMSILSYKPKHNLLTNTENKTSTPTKHANTSLNTPSIHIKNSPVLSPISSKPILCNKQDLDNSSLYTFPNLSFMQKEQIKHDNIELYLTKSNGRSPLMKNRLLTPICEYSPKKNSSIRTLGNVRINSAHPTHIFKQDDQAKKWGSSLVEFMKDMCIK